MARKRKPLGVVSGEGSRPSPRYFEQRGRGHASKASPKEQGYYARGARHSSHSGEGVIYVEVRVNSAKAIAKLDKAAAALNRFAQSLRDTFGSAAKVRNDIRLEVINEQFRVIGLRISESLAETIAANARRLSPVDTGLMKSSIFVAPLASGDGFGVIVDVPYAEWVEFGHMGVNGNFVPPNPFFRNAIFLSIDKMKDLVGSLQLGRHSIDSAARYEFHGDRNYQVHGFGDLGFFD